MDLSVVLTSAVVGSAAGGVMGGLFTLISQHLERRARREDLRRERQARQQELLLKTAADLAIVHLKEAMHSARIEGGV